MRREAGPAAGCERACGAGGPGAPAEEGKAWLGGPEVEFREEGLEQRPWSSV